MLVVAKKHHINANITGSGIDFIIAILQKEIPNIKISENNDELISSDESEWFMKMQSEWHAGKTLAVRRRNAGLTQKKLSEKTGIAVPNISQMENGKRAIGASTAKKLAKVLNCSVADFL